MIDPSGDSRTATPTRQHGESKLRAYITSVQWRWVLLAGAGAAVLSSVLTGLVISLYATILSARTGGTLDMDQLTRFAATMGEWGSMALNIALTFAGGAWVARRAGKAVILHGALVGLASNLFGLTLGTLFSLAYGASGTVPDAVYLVINLLTIGAGLLGSMAGRASMAGREALYRASQAISVADSPQAIAAAVGEHLAGPEVSQVSVWRVVSQDADDVPAEIALLAAWTPRETQARTPDLRLDAAQAPTLARLQPKTPLPLQVHKTDPHERAIWERLGIRSALLLPLTAPDSTWLGVLMVASRTSGGFRRGAWRAHLISTQVALALENLRLVEQARQAAVLEERQRLAREIHDTLAQGFTSIVMHLEAAEQALTGKPATVQQHLDQARHTARESLAEARRLVWALRPEHLEHASLPEAVARVAARWEEESGIAVEVTATGAVTPLHPEIEITLLRAAQEALANVRKHARAGRVTVTLSYMDDLVALDVQDDGVGFNLGRVHAPPTAQAGGGFGLTAMRERVEQLGGTLLVESAPGEGTTLVVEIPVSQEEQ